MRNGFVAVVTALVLVVFAGGAVAGEAAKTAVARAFETGRLAEGAKELEALAAGDEADEALFGLGMIRFVQAFEHLSQGLYKYGLQPPHSVLMPIVRLPVPINPNSRTHRLPEVPRYPPDIRLRFGRGPGNARQDWDR